MTTTTLGWLDRLGTLLRAGVSHRDTLEQRAAVFNYLTSEPVINATNRKIGYRFMAAEALYILEGRNDIDFLEQYVPGFSRFSDDGFFQAGAYGPKIMDQLPYILRAIEKDENTRQAVLTIWRERPYDSKDIPCTIGMQFLPKDGVLDTVVYMRSSDAYTGLIYDTFCFAVISSIVAYFTSMGLGRSSIMMGSSHLYERDATAAGKLFMDHGSMRNMEKELDPISPDEMKDWLRRAVASDTPLEVLLNAPQL